MASRMESTGEASKIHISDATKKILEKNPNYRFECRGNVEIKGIGKQTTWWLFRNNRSKFQNNLMPLTNDRPLRMSLSKDRLLRSIKCIKSDNNFRRSSGFALREDSFDLDLGILQNAVKSNRNLIGCDDPLTDSILSSERRPIHKSNNHSDHHLSLKNSSTSNFIEFPNSSKCNLTELVYSSNNPRLINGNKFKEYYDHKDRLLISSDLISNQSNDLNSEQYDSYDNSFNLDNCTKQPLSKKFHIGKSSNDDYYSSSETIDQKSKSKLSKSCSELRISPTTTTKNIF